MYDDSRLGAFQDMADAESAIREIKRLLREDDRDAAAAEMARVGRVMARAQMRIATRSTGAQ